MAASTATIAAGIVPLAATSASAVTAISISPTSDTETTMNCNPFTVTTDANTTIDVYATQQAAATTTGGVSGFGGTYIAFCDVSQYPTTSNPNPQPGPAVANPGADFAQSTTTPPVTNTVAIDGTFNTGPTGKFTFGVLSDSAGTMNITAYQDTSGNHLPDVFETPQAHATKNWVANQASSPLTCTPASETNPTGGTHSWTCTAKTSAGTGVNDTSTSGSPAPVVRWVVTSGPDSGQKGNCTYDTSAGTGSAGGTFGNWACGSINNGANGTGTDSIFVWVDNNANNGAEANEPNTTITKTWAQAAPTGSTLAVTCSPNQTTAGTGGSGSICQDPLTDKTVTFTASVANGTPPTAQSGVLVQWAITNNTPGTNEPSTDTESLNAASCTTDSTGKCSVTLTNNTPTEGESITVTATMPRQSGGSVTATSTKNWHNPGNGEARNITVAPKTASQPSGGVQAFTATVTDRFGNPVSGVVVNWSESGPGAFRNGVSQCTTDATGKCTIEVQSLATESGDETVTATITYGAAPGTAATASSECNAPAGYSNYNASGTLANGGTTPNAGGQNNVATGAPAGNCADSGKVTWGQGTTGAVTIDNVSQPNKTAGTPVVLTGHAPASSTVQIFYKNATTGGAFVAYGNAVAANSAGNWSFTFTPAYNGTYYAQVGSGSSAQKSNQVTVNVNVKVTITDIRYLGKDARGKCVTRFLGGTFPFIPGAPAWIRNSAVSPTQPIGFTRVFQFGSSGRYDARFGLTCGQTYRLFSLISGTGSNGVKYTDNGVGKDITYKAGTSIHTGQ